jgi:orc1/cdc6 family replication initiation protein
MGLEPFSRDDQIFKHEDVLRDSYRPENLLEREQQITSYQNALKPVIKGARPRNIFLYGQSGVGKTIATKLVLNRLQKDAQNYDNLSIRVIQIVCKNLNNSYQAAVKLVNQFRDQENKIPSTGYPADSVYGFLYDHIRELDETHMLFVLDEVDGIEDNDDILYELPRANDNGNVSTEDTKVGVIGISNKFTFRDNLSARVKDSLCDEEIHFTPYDANQLGSILEQRVEKAFIDNVVEEGVIQLAAAMAGQESGSARQALKILFTAGDIARSQDDQNVTEQHVRDAEPMVKESQIKNELHSIPTQSHLTLYSLLMLEKQDKLPVKSSEIYDYYEVAAEKIGSDIKTNRTVRNRLSQLKLKGFLNVEERNMGSRGGSYFLYSFGDIRPKMVESVLQDVDRLKELFQD